SSQAPAPCYGCPASGQDYIIVQKKFAHRKQVTEISNRKCKKQILLENPTVVCQIDDDLSSHPSKQGMQYQGTHNHNMQCDSSERVKSVSKDAPTKLDSINFASEQVDDIVNGIFWCF
uniref:Uncharacterized protein n=1 Tax=Romanomermis culicivorax TaxID=13658 RepID=A0A915IL27_ROMCU